MFKRYLVKEDIISSTAVTVQKFDKHHNTTSRTRIALNDFYGIQTINNRRIGSGMHYTSGFGSNGYRSYVGTNQFQSQNIGDIVFLQSNAPSIIIRGIPYSYGIAAMARAARKQLIDSNVNDGMNSMYGRDEQR